MFMDGSMPRSLLSISFQKTARLSLITKHGFCIYTILDAMLRDAPGSIKLMKKCTKTGKITKHSEKGMTSQNISQKTLRSLLKEKIYKWVELIVKYGRWIFAIEFYGRRGSCPNILCYKEINHMNSLVI